MRSNTIITDNLMTNSIPVEPSYCNLIASHPTTTPPPHLPTQIVTEGHANPLYWVCIDNINRS
jgi:hypothetical protein